MTISLRNQAASLGGRARPNISALTFLPLPTSPPRIAYPATRSLSIVSALGIPDVVVSIVGSPLEDNHIARAINLGSPSSFAFPTSRRHTRPGKRMSQGQDGRRRECDGVSRLCLKSCIHQTFSHNLPATSGSSSSSPPRDHHDQPITTPFWSPMLTFSLGSG